MKGCLAAAEARLAVITNLQLLNANARGLLATLGALVPLSIGTIVLAGWISGIPILITFVPGEVTMKVNTALGFLFFGLANLALRFRHPSLSRWFVALPILFGVLTLVQYVSKADLGIDELFFREPTLTSGTSHPGRMAPNTAATFILFGVAHLLGERASNKLQRASQALVLCGLFITFLAFLGYVYRAHVLVGLFSLTRMAVHTVAGFFALGAALLGRSRDRGWLADVSLPGPGRVIAKRLFTAAFAIPVGVGAIVLGGYRAGLYDPAFAACLMACAETMSFSVLVWLAVRTVNSSERERTLSRVDELTGLHNRRGFLLSAGEELVRCRDQSLACLLIFVDLDGMKQVNDTLGHSVGDTLLCDAAKVLRSAFRANDVIGRLGGDEFIVLAVGADATDEQKLSERLRTCVAEHRANGGRPYKLALSHGVTVIDAACPLSLEELVIRADLAMYARKKERRLARAAGLSSWAPAALTTRENSIRPGAMPEGDSTRPASAPRIRNISS